MNLQWKKKNNCPTPSHLNYTSVVHISYISHIRLRSIFSFKKPKEKGSKPASASCLLRKLQTIHSVAYFRPRNKVMTVRSHTYIHTVCLYVCICDCNWFALKSVRTLQCIAAPALWATNNGNEICIGDAFRNRTKKQTQVTRLFLLLLQLLLLLLLLLWLCHGKSRMCMVYILTDMLQSELAMPESVFLWASLVDVTVFLAYLLNCKDTKGALINILYIYNALINTRIYNMFVNRFIASSALRGNEANIFALI